MSRMKKGNGLLRFLVFAALFALVLTGCNGARKYEAVDLSSETAAGAEMSGNGADLAAESTDTGASGSGDADVQALGEAAGEPLSADPGPESPGRPAREGGIRTYGIKIEII